MNIEAQPAQPGGPIETDAVIIGAGPVGLFAVFELGLLGLQAHVVDILDRPGGQCAELYPEKVILDIPSRLRITGAELSQDMLKQVEPFKPVFHFQEMGEKLVKRDNGKWLLTTDMGTEIEAAVVVIAGGGGSFTPKKPKLERLDEFEGAGYRRVIATVHTAAGEVPASIYVLAPQLGGCRADLIRPRQPG